MSLYQEDIEGFCPRCNHHVTTVLSDGVGDVCGCYDTYCKTCGFYDNNMPMLSYKCEAPFGLFYYRDSENLYGAIAIHTLNIMDLYIGDTPIGELLGVNVDAVNLSEDDFNKLINLLASPYLFIKNGELKPAKLERILSLYDEKTSTVLEITFNHGEVVSKTCLTGHLENKISDNTKEWMRTVRGIAANEIEALPEKLDGDYRTIDIGKFKSLEVAFV